MDKKGKFLEDIINGYSCNGDSILLGCAMLDGEPVAGAHPD